jgi:hypothetical protein
MAGRESKGRGAEDRMISATQQTAALPVCPESEVVTLFPCAHCSKPFVPANKRQRFCDGTCRVNAHRAPQRAKRWRWDAARNFYRTMQFDGRVTGPIRNIGPLALFEKGEKA